MRTPLTTCHTATFHVKHRIEVAFVRDATGGAIRQRRPIGSRSQHRSAIDLRLRTRRTTEMVHPSLPCSWPSARRPGAPQQAVDTRARETQGTHRSGCVCALGTSVDAPPTWGVKNRGRDALRATRLQRPGATQNPSSRDIAFPQCDHQAPQVRHQVDTRTVSRETSVIGPALRANEAFTTVMRSMSVFHVKHHLQANVRSAWRGWGV